MDLRNVRVLVTGGAGFIGSHLTDALVERGCEVVVLDNFSSGRPENLTAAVSRGRVRIVEGSILDRDALAAAMAGCTHVFHLAVECVRRSLGAPIANHDTNATGTLYVLEAARRENVRRFVFCSSSEVYGNCGVEWLVEASTVCAPVTVYGAAKLAGEHYTQAYVQTYGLPAAIVRPFNAYGPREHERGDLAEVIPRFVIRALNGLPPVIFGSGANGRDFTYVTEIAQGILAAAECDAMIGRVANIAYGRMITISEVARAVTAACGRPDLEAVHIDERPGDVRALQADTAVARRLFGYRAETEFRAGLERYVQWFRAHHDDVASLVEADPVNWQIAPA
jgi:UDP-glucose 4-epimerase